MDKIPFKIRLKNFFGKANKRFQTYIFDIFMFIALGMIFKGLYIYQEWIAWTVVGFLLLIISALAVKQ